MSVAPATLVSLVIYATARMAIQELTLRLAPPHVTITHFCEHQGRGCRDRERLVSSGSLRLAQDLAATLLS